MTMIGSARSDENGNISGGKAGDQTKKEVCTQAYYMHSKGWLLLRAKDDKVANNIASAMIDACANDNIGYDQSQRDSIVPLFKKNMDLSKIDKPCECDCSKLVQVCVWQATGKDPGNFTTAGAVNVLSRTGHFNNVIAVDKNTPLYTGDILCTKTKGHIAVVTEGIVRGGREYVTTANLHIRSGAGTNNAVLGVLKRGVTCTLIEKGYKVGGAEWYKVKAGDITGFVSSKYLTTK